MMYLDQLIAECKTPYSIRFRVGAWWIYRNTEPVMMFADARQALAGLRSLTAAEITRQMP
jgi:hypothetical protein